MRVLRIAFLLITGYTSCFSQELKVQATYHSSKDTLPYKVEQIYKTDSSTYFVYHKNKASKAILQSKTLKGDSLILSEAYCNLYPKSWQLLKSDSSVYNPNSTNFNLVLSVIEKNVKVSFDSLKLLEVYNSYFVNGLLVKFTVLDENRDKHLTTVRTNTNKNVFFNTTFEKDDKTLYRAYYINADTSEILAYSKAPWYAGYTFVSIDDSSMIRSSTKNKFTYEEFLKCDNIFNRLLLNDIVYNDTPFWFVELFDDTKGILKYKEYYLGSEVKTNVTFDSNGYISQKETYQNGAFSRIIYYEYFD